MVCNARAPAARTAPGPWISVDPPLHTVHMLKLPNSARFRGRWFSTFSPFHRHQAESAFQRFSPAYLRDLDLLCANASCVASLHKFVADPGAQVPSTLK